jgi:hypothetical protein
MKTIAKEYVLLFNAVTDAEESLRQLRETLITVQREAEELFLDEEQDCCICQRQESEPVVR